MVTPVLRRQNLAFILRLLLGAIFVFSATAKLIHHDEFAMAVQNYGILPLTSVRRLSMLFSFLELEVGSFLLAGLAIRFTAGIAGILMLGFLALMGMAMAQGKAFDCGCFSGVIEEMLGPSTILRDLAMLAMLLPILLWPQHPFSLDPRFPPFRRPLIRNMGVLGAFTLLVLGVGLAFFYSGPILGRILGNAQTAPLFTLRPDSDGSGRLASGWLAGSPDARIQIVIYSDFRCPLCQIVADELQDLVGESNGEVAVIFHHYVLKQHELSQTAAEATEAAGEQGQFWPMHDAVFAEQEQLTEDSFRVIAERIGLDLARYDESLASGRPKARVSADIVQADRLGVNYTPYIFVDGRLFTEHGSLKRDVENKIGIKQP